MGRIIPFLFFLDSRLFNNFIFSARAAKSRAGRTAALTVDIIYRLLSDDFNQDALSPAAVKLPVKDLLPGSEVQFPFADGYHDLPAHDLALQMGIAIAFPGPVVPVARNGFVGGQFLQPLIIILMQPRLVIVNEHGGGDVHGVDKGQAFPDAALLEAGLYLGSDVHKSPLGGNIEPQLLAKALHGDLSLFKPFSLFFTTN